MSKMSSRSANILSLAPFLATATQGETLELRPSGSWTAIHANALESLFDVALPKLQQATNLKIDMTDVRELDTLGAWLLEKMLRRAAGVRPSRDPCRRRWPLCRFDRRCSTGQPPQTREPDSSKSLSLRGWKALAVPHSAPWQEISVFLQMLGALGSAGFGVLRRPRSLRLKSLVYHLHQVGWKAIPIIALVTFLIGAIIAQQGIFHFRKFGAESYVVDLVGILVLREIGVLIVAIMVAGRSGSAYTAELGSMKMREEIDALSTMGLDPVEVLILPRIIALVCALPILAFIGSMAALYGGGLVAWSYGGMSPATFIARLHEAVSVTHFEVGMIKAPFMALVIGIVASSEGLRVKGSAESLGKQTTISVVKSIFLVIVLDGVFAVFFASIGM